MKKQFLLVLGIIAMMIVSCGSPKTEKAPVTTDSVKTVWDTIKTDDNVDTLKVDTLVKK